MKKKYKIIGIETSCDETGVSLLEFEKEFPLRSKIKKEYLASSLSLHKKWGGIVPEVAARKQIEFLPLILEKILKEENVKLKEISAIAVTVGPGLVGSLLVGVETAKTLAHLLKLPLIPVNHILGHLYANFLQNEKIFFPALVLTVSGGHTSLILMNGFMQFEILGETLDDAAGEAFDKAANLLGLGFPGGPAISATAEKCKMQNVKCKATLSSDDNE